MMRRCLASVLLAMLLAAGASLGAVAGPASGPYPPWQGGANNDVAARGLEFTVPEVDDLPDFHGDPFTAKLVLYVGGNYYFAMAPLVAEFERERPELKGGVYWETIPPGLARSARPEMCAGLPFGTMMVSVLVT